MRVSWWALSHESSFTPETSPLTTPIQIRTVLILTTHNAHAVLYPRGEVYSRVFVTSWVKL